MTELGEWSPTGWWRVIEPDGSLWCETSNEQEARESMRPGDRLDRHERITFERWTNQYVKPGGHRLSCPARLRDVPCECGAES